MEGDRARRCISLEVAGSLVVGSDSPDCEGVAIEKYLQPGIDALIEAIHGQVARCLLFDLIIESSHLAEVWVEGTHVWTFSFRAHFATIIGFVARIVTS